MALKKNHILRAPIFHETFAIWFKSRRSIDSHRSFKVHIKVLIVGVVWCNEFFNLRIDDIEDEIYREKLKIKKVSDELSDTFDDMLDNY